MTFEITEQPDGATDFHAAVRQGISQADPGDVTPRDWRALLLAIHDLDGTLVGGLEGATMWGWLMVDAMWVAETHRGLGLGGRLLQEAERIAVERGCTGAWLGTFDFQARTFYEHHGYQVFAELPGFPPGHAHYHLRKTFD